jgi:hypothetical protein
LARNTLGNRCSLNIWTLKKLYDLWAPRLPAKSFTRLATLVLRSIVDAGVFVRRVETVATVLPRDRIVAFE